MPGIVEIHQDGVGREGARQGHGLRAVGRLTDDLDVAGAKELTSLAEERMIVGEQRSIVRSPPNGPAPTGRWSFLRRAPT